MERTIILLGAGCLMLLASCNTQFNRQWKMSGKTASSATGIEGRWEGTWKSQSNGHTGKLLCVVGSASNADGDHPFNYRATWGRFFSGSFESTHQVKRASQQGFTFHGTHKMPAWVGDTYTYDGTINDGRFNASYRSSQDHGTFEMMRPAGQ